MELSVLDINLEVVAIADIYQSFIWTDRYYKCGDFELYTPIQKDILAYMKKNYYVQNRDSEHVMIIEKIQISSDVEDGNTLIITGRSLESILDRRIIWGQMHINGNLQDGIKTLLDACVINPIDPKRKIDNFVFEASTDPNITNLTINAQYTGDNLYDVICNICSENSIGFKITLNNKQFVFKLYAGVDRSYMQNNNPYVVFSPNYENIINSNYIETNSLLKNVTLIGGEGEGAARRYQTIGDSSGLNRREIFTDARDISSETETGVKLSDDEYNALLIQRGKEKILENTDVTSFDGQVETTVMYKYGEDFFIGDIVQFADEYDHDTAARITEIVISEDEEGTSVFPTFETLQEGV